MALVTPSYHLATLTPLGNRIDGASPHIPMHRHKFPFISTPVWRQLSPPPFPQPSSLSPCPRPRPKRNAFNSGVQCNSPSSPSPCLFTPHLCRSVFCIDLILCMMVCLYPHWIYNLYEMGPWVGGNIIHNAFCKRLQWGCDCD